jgi:hypothetical protein
MAAGPLPVEVAQSRVISAALRVLSGDYEETAHGHSDAEAEYASERLALAARELMRAVDARPAAERPEGWNARPAPDSAAARAWRALGPPTQGEIQNRVKTAALRVMLAEYDDEDEIYAAERLALACKTLTRRVDAQPKDGQPVGWRENRRPQ